MKKNYIYVEDKKNNKYLIYILKLDENMLYLRLDIQGDKFSFNQDIVLRNLKINYSGTDIYIMFKPKYIYLKIKKFIFSAALKILKAKESYLYLEFEGKLGFILNKIILPLIKKFSSFEEDFFEVKDNLIVLNLNKLIENGDIKKIDINFNFLGEEVWKKKL